MQFWSAFFFKFSIILTVGTQSCKLRRNAAKEDDEEKQQKNNGKVEGKEVCLEDKTTKTAKQNVI